MGKQNIKANIANTREALEKMALDIWAKPEAGFREFNATKLQQDYQKNMGLRSLHQWMWLKLLSSLSMAAASRSSVFWVSSMLCPV